MMNRDSWLSFPAGEYDEKRYNLVLRRMLCIMVGAFFLVFGFFLLFLGMTGGHLLKGFQVVFWPLFAGTQMLYSAVKLHRKINEYDAQKKLATTP